MAQMAGLHPARRPGPPGELGVGAAGEPACQTGCVGARGQVRTFGMLA